MGDLRMVFMLFLVIGVAGSMCVIVRMFRKRLKHIEDDYWGPAPGKAGKSEKVDRK
jgi:heme/copper-type cytochrome/quinol oxidase subunit 2